MNIIYILMYNALCEYKGAEGNYRLPSSFIIFIIIPLYRILYTAFFILVAPPAALLLNYINPPECRMLIQSPRQSYQMRLLIY